MGLRKWYRTANESYRVGSIKRAINCCRIESIRLLSRPWRIGNGEIQAFTAADERIHIDQVP
jgi:hypothetical protein